MKKRLLLQVARFSTFIAVVLGSLIQNAVAQAYPQYRLTPQNPKYGDSVSLWVVKGQESTNCVPMYHTSFKKTPDICITAACTLVALTISYQEYMPNYFVCLQTLTEYGPRFDFGKLSIKKYAIIDSATNQELFRFQVSGAYCTIKGTVETPSSPGLARRADTVSFFPLPVPTCTVMALVPYQTLQSKVMAITDAAGRYVIDSIEAWNCFGDSVLVVTKKNGYAELRKTVVLTGKDSVQADFSLTKIATGISLGIASRIGNMRDEFSIYSLDGRCINGRSGRHIRSSRSVMNAPGGLAILRSVKNGISETRIIKLGSY